MRRSGMPRQPANIAIPNGYVYRAAWKLYEHKALLQQIDISSVADARNEAQRTVPIYCEESFSV